MPANHERELDDSITLYIGRIVSDVHHFHGAVDLLLLPRSQGQPVEAAVNLLLSGALPAAAAATPAVPAEAQGQTEQERRVRTQTMREEKARQEAERELARRRIAEDRAAYNEQRGLKATSSAQPDTADSALTEEQQIAADRARRAEERRKEKENDRIQRELTKQRLEEDRLERLQRQQPSAPQPASAPPTASQPAAQDPHAPTGPWSLGLRGVGCPPQLELPAGPSTTIQQLHDLVGAAAGVPKVELKAGFPPRFT